MDKIQKTAVITGANAGIGFQTALDFAQSGAFVIGVGRNPQKCAAARQKILSVVPAAQIYFLTADLSSQAQIRGLATQIQELLDQNQFKALDVLVNNAGLYMGKKVLTEDGVETTFAVNHLAPFLLTHLLLPRLIASPDARVITVSSDSHYHTRLLPEVAANPFFFFGLSAYKVSKLCNVLFSVKFNQLYRGKSVHAFAVDPGLVNTEIGLKNTGSLASLVWRSRKKLGVSPKVPAETILYLATNPDVIHSSAVYWHECKEKQPSRKALNENLANRLWKKSCSLCGISSTNEGE